MTRLFLIFRLVFMVGYYNEFKVVRRNIFSKIVFNTIKKLRGINPMGLSTPWADSFEIFALHPEMFFSRD